MKLSRETLNILKNFSAINSNLTIIPGNKITTVSVQRNILAEAIVPETFEKTFGIYSLPDFLSALSLFSDPHLVFGDKAVTIAEAGNCIKFFAADTAILTAIPVLKEMPEPSIVVDISKDTLQQVLKAANVLRAPDFFIQCDGESIAVMVGDGKNATSNSFRSVLVRESPYKSFSINLKVENLRMILDDYTVSVSGRNMFKMTAKNLNVCYYIAMETTSEL